MTLSILHNPGSVFIFISDNDPRKDLPQVLHVAIGKYAAGFSPPKFPVPAIIYDFPYREEKWEWPYGYY